MRRSIVSSIMMRNPPITTRIPPIRPCPTTNSMVPATRPKLAISQRSVLTLFECISSPPSRRVALPSVAAGVVCTVSVVSSDDEVVLSTIATAPWEGPNCQFALSPAG